MAAPHRHPTVAGPRRRWPPRLFVPTERAGLRATWHRDDDEFVLSMWHGDECVATTPLTPADAAELSSFLVSHLGDRSTWTPRVVRGSERGAVPADQPGHATRIATWLATARRRLERRRG